MHVFRLTGRGRCQAGLVGSPIAWAGPIVINTEEELQTAWDELNNGTFIKAT
jgi:redox-sensitive bicupin YhaK (pirin superfamily)